MIVFLSKGGLLVGPILICSVVAVAIFLERWFRFARASLSGRGLSETIIELVRDGNVDLAEQQAKGSDSPLGRVMAAVFDVRGQRRELAEAVVANEAEEQIRGLTRYLKALATIGSITPMLGLLGTVTGMIKAFMVIQQTGGEVNASILAGGIWEAMLTTALGLAVALPTMVAHGYLDARVEGFEANIRASVVALSRSLDNRQSKEDRP